ncbi:MAG: hypothetical protein JEY99_14515 [Spirochaetales bacterium]|nr:hypothetical protein [Spirochaetales bacterium]
MRKHKSIRISLFLLLFLSLTIGYATAQDADAAPEFGFGLGMDLGVATFLDDSNNEVTYQRVGFVPDISFGKFGLSLDLSFHVRSNPSNPDMPFEFRTEDWVPDDETSFLELYLPKFNYVRYGTKGENLFVKMGSIDDATLGVGFIMGNYSNAMMLPNEKLFGLTLDMDGKLFGFPYVGFESFVGNLAAPDVMGGRLYGRPMAWSSIPILDMIEVGFTVAGDISPDARPEYFTELSSLYSVDVDGNLDEDINSVAIWGIDVIQPILSNPVISLAAFTSVAFEPISDGTTESTSSGMMIGAGGRLISFIPFMAQLRFLGENFIPSYFDTTYDLYRAQKYAVLSGKVDSIDPFVGWLASSGFSFLEDKVAFSVSIDGPFAAAPSGDISEHSATEYPHLKAAFTLAEDLIPGVFFDAYYDKQYIAAFSDIFDATGAVIGANINYKTGPAVITLNYDVKYDPATGDFTTAAKLMTSLDLF